MGVELELQNFINGEFVSTADYIDSYDPSTGEVWSRVPNSSVAEVDQAVQAAKKAFKTWKRTSISERVGIMLRIADAIDENVTELAELGTRDLGIPLMLCKMFAIPFASQCFRYFAGKLEHQNNMARFFEPGNCVEYTYSHPVGVAGLINAWNLPLGLLAFKMAPAMAWGNTVVFKESEMTSAAGWKFCSLLNKAGVPPGVVNMVFGTGALTGDAIVRHPDVPLISFTGGTAIATVIRKACVTMCKKLSFELGGKNPAIVFDDANMAETLPTCVRSAFAGQGQMCLCSSRIFVQTGVYDTFLEQFVAAARKMKVGDPKDADCEQGPLVSAEHKARVMKYIDLAHQGAGRVVCGEGVDDLDLPDRVKDGYYMRPTVITDTPDDGRLMQEEIFGPVVCIVPFDTEEEVIERANNVEYGLCAAVFTGDSSRMQRVCKELEAGTVWGNCWLERDLQMPFGGFKNSAVGCEGGDYSKEFFTEPKAVCIKM